MADEKCFFHNILPIYGVIARLRSSRGKLLPRRVVADADPYKIRIL